MDELAIFIIPGLTVLILLASGMYAHIKSHKKANRRNQHLQKWVRAQDPPPRIMYRQR